MGKLYRGWNKE